MTEEQAWAMAIVLAKGTGRTHYVAESIHHRGTFVALNLEQYDILRGRNWLAHYIEAVPA